MSDQLPVKENKKQNQSEVKNTSMIAYVAIVIALGALILATHNAYKNIKNNVSLNRSVNTLQSEMRQEVKQSAQDHDQAHNGVATAVYLIQLANLQLTVHDNPAAALKTALIAQQQLTTQDNPAYASVKEALDSDILSLQSAPTIDENQLFLDISNISVAIQNLSSIPSNSPVSLEKTMNAIKHNDSAILPWYQRLLKSLAQVKTLFVIRHLDQPSVPLVMPDQEAAVKKNIAMQLTIAQWGLLNHREAIYQTSLKTVSQWLAQYFGLSAAVNPIVAQLQTLLKINIHPALPTFTSTLNALSAISPGAIPVETIAAKAPVQAAPAAPVTPAPIVPQVQAAPIPPVSPAVPTQQKPVQPKQNTVPPKNNAAGVEA
jgi:uncharacterized protein HemX